MKKLNKNGCGMDIMIGFMIGLVIFLIIIVIMAYINGVL